jgi:hypothetical protein
MSDDNKIEKLLFDIGLQLGFVQKKWGLPWSSATVRARRNKGFDPDITIKFADGCTGFVAEYYDIPKFVKKIVKVIDVDIPNVEILTIRMSNGKMLLKALAADGKICKGGRWHYTFDRETENVPQPSLEQLADAKDVTNVPRAFASRLRKLNEAMRNSFYPLTPSHEIPVKFWKIKNKDIFYGALYYFPGYFFDKLDPYYYDRRPIPDLPIGYLPAYTVFESLNQLENEGLATAIANKGSNFYREVSTIYRAVGLVKLANLYRSALAAYDDDSYENPSKKFEQINSAISNAVNTQKHANSLIKYFYRPELFEQVE